MAKDRGDGYDSAAAFFQHVRDESAEGRKVCQCVYAKSAENMSEKVKSHSRIYIPFHIFSSRVEN
jgi:hypothetical protein